LHTYKTPQSRKPGCTAIYRKFDRFVANISVFGDYPWYNFLNMEKKPQELSLEEIVRRQEQKFSGSRSNLKKSYIAVPVPKDTPKKR